ncbi:MAG: hypothetical protein M0T75_06120 [Chloroflexi bacterium]|nr:hypothetical protein [Chloroflexota bacterium]
MSPPAGAVVYRDEESPRLVVVAGLLRVHLTSADGRQVTVRYARSGDVAGLALDHRRRPPRARRRVAGAALRRPVTQAAPAP